MARSAEFEAAFERVAGRPAVAAHALTSIMGIFGKDVEWSGADICEDVARVLDAVADMVELPRISNQDGPALRHWCAVAGAEVPEGYELENDEDENGEEGQEDG